MIKSNLRIWMALILLALPVGMNAQAVPAANSTEGPATSDTVATTPTAEANADGTREEFRQLLRDYPPDLGRVLKIDPALMTNESYMAAYPALKTFVAQHPEVTRNSDFYLRDIWIPADKGPEELAIDLWMDMLGGLAALLVFGVVTTILVWLVKTVLEQRRWSRLSNVQTEVHTKLLDRFTTNEDLLAYMETPSGKRFLEAAPIAVDVSPSRGVSAPVGRILWSVQVGVVLTTLGAGLQLVSGHVAKEIAPPLFVMGVVAVSIGIGFVLSAIISYALSRKLGLIEIPASSVDTDGSGSSLA